MPALFNISQLPFSSSSQTIRLTTQPDKSFRYEIVEDIKNLETKLTLIHETTICFTMVTQTIKAQLHIKPLTFDPAFLPLTGAIQEFLHAIFSQLATHYTNGIISIHSIFLWNVFFLGTTEHYEKDKKYENTLSDWIECIKTSQRKRLKILKSYHDSYVPSQIGTTANMELSTLFNNNKKYYARIGIKSTRQQFYSYCLFLSNECYRTKLQKIAPEALAHYTTISETTFYPVNEEIRVVPTAQGHLRILPQNLTTRTISQHVIAERYRCNIKRLNEIGPLLRPSIAFPPIGPHNTLPNKHHVIWAGVEMPESYKMQLAKACQLNPDYEHHLWWCPEMLSKNSIERINTFAKRFHITLHNILHTDFENKDLIHHYLQQHQFGRFSDILRYEEALAGIYTDTDVRYKKPFPLAAQLNNVIQQNYGLMTSEESKSIGISNSLLIRPYGCPVMQECRRQIAAGYTDQQHRQLPKINGHSPSETSVLHETGPCFLSQIIAKVILNDPNSQIYNLHQTTINFEKLVFTRAFPTSVNVPCDLTWTKEGRKKFETREHDVTRAINTVRHLWQQKMAVTHAPPLN